MTASTAPVSCVSITLPPETAGALFEMIDSDGFTPASWHDVESGVCRVSLFPDESDGVAHARDALLAAAALLGVKVEPEITTVAQTDWAESWKQFFHVEKISERVVVRPSWEPYTAQPGERVITLDPGLSFGTGKHATTQACLRFLDRLAAEDINRSVLDMGCGSGILAIGAKLLGFSDVRGFDNDPDCMRVSGENAALNGVSIPFTLDDLSHAHAPADIVVANILAPVLIRFAPQVAASLAAGPRARLVVSGILDEQYAAVRAAYEAQGLRQLDTLLIENWRSGLFTV
ncbi:MAG TPA: 50S ribosomal protein L11 methyltransferase [Kiritimatiellia bacterium]|nr:50S ribosomal protein L11 methyltransferase [Kiritimatiellia bacterium]HRU70476.1 50S ribosomal protein L11 methyltransferase [Kiritimatiellia bacterium]